MDNGYPADRLQIIVIDGRSSDGTIDEVRSMAKSNSNIEVVTNDKIIFPCAMNLGIEAAKGEVILIAGAHAKYEKHYIERCVNCLREFKAQNVGGFVRQEWPETSYIGGHIIASLSSRFGVGGSVYRTTGASEPQFVDTVFGGCYLKDVFEKVGNFNENLISSADIEMNARIRAHGGKILFHPEILSVYYYHKTKTRFTAFIKHNMRNGFWAIYPLRFVEIIPVSIRHFVPLGFVCGLFFPLILSVFWSPFMFLSILTTGLYLLANFYFSYVREKQVKVMLPLFFLSLHLAYGLASLWAFLRLLVSVDFYRLRFRKFFRGSVPKLFS